MVDLPFAQHKPKLTIGGAIGRLFAALLMLGPGMTLLGFYARRLMVFRADPANAPGTPAETWIALMVMGSAYVSAWLSAQVFTGRMSRPSAAAAFMCLFVVTLVIGGAFVGFR